MIHTDWLYSPVYLEV